MISGISNSVLVVEAPEKSGALITARHALEQGRDVYAVPCGFNIPSGKGSNALLKDGAAMAECGWDILEQYQAMYPGRVVHREEGPDLSEMSGIPRKSWEDRPQKEKKPPRTVVSEKKVIDNGPKPPYIDVEKKPLAGTPEEQSIPKGKPQRWQKMKVRLHGLFTQPHALGMDTSTPAASAEGQVLPQLLPWALPSSE